MDTKQRRRVQRGFDRIFYAGDSIHNVPLVRGGAGSYADVPSRRMATDADGSVVAYYSSTAYSDPVEYSGGVITNMNGEADTIGPDFNQFGLLFIFAELREVDGAFLWADSATTRRLVTSGDTTNGVDGTWTQRFADMPSAYESPTFDRTKYRTNIDSMAVSNVRGLRCEGPFGDFAGGDTDLLHHFHIYGEIAAGETPDRLLWIDNDDDLEFSKPQDYGDVPRGSAEDHVTYLKNNSASLSANSVQVTAEALSFGAGSWYTFDDGTGFSATKSLASSIGNGANSPDITIRRIIPDAEDLGLYAARAYASVGSWT